MLRVRYDDPKAMVAWAEECIGLEPFSPHANAIGVERDGRLVGVAVFDRFTSWGCEFSLASDGSRRWLNREFMRRCAAYVFDQLGLERVTCMAAVKNQASVGLLRHFGMVEEGRLRRANSQDDVLVFGMLRRECQWCPPLRLRR